jgi:hypothetical protein
MRRRWGRFIQLSLLAATGIADGSCGADNMDAPAGPPAPQQCQSLSQMAPAFTSIILNQDSLDSQQLKYLVQNYLLQPAGPGGEAPIVELLQIGFDTINTFANDPPELGGNPCNDANPPPPVSANRICDLRRMMYQFVHQGTGLTALTLLDPTIYDVFGYIRGDPALAADPPNPTTPHYEIADFISRSCSTPGLCKMTSAFDLLAGVLDYLRPPRGQSTLSDIVTLWNDPNLTGPNGFLTNLDVQGNLGEDGFVALGQFLVSAILEMKDDSTYFDNIQNVLNQFIYPNINDTQYPGLHAELDAVVADVQEMLDPTRAVPVLQPLQDAAYCYSEVDQDYFNKQSDMIRMIYRLSFVANVLGLKDLLSAFQGLMSLDPQGIVIETLYSLVVAFRGDDLGMSALADLCSTALTNTPDSSGQANAQRIVPVAADLFQQGAAAELLCVADTFLYGCTGGAQPACPSTQQ